MYLSISSINLSKEIEFTIISLEKQIKTIKQEIKSLNTQIDKLPKSIWEEEDKKEYNRRFENIYREHNMELPYDEPFQFKNTIKKMTLNEYLKSLR
jgi:cell division protein FtsB